AWRACRFVACGAAERAAVEWRHRRVVGGRGIHLACVGPGGSCVAGRAGLGLVAVAGRRGRRCRGGTVGRAICAGGRGARFSPGNPERSDMRRAFVVKELASGNAFMRYDASVITQPHVGLFDPGHAALDARPVSEGGRQAAWYVRCGSHDAVLRHYRRGGLAAKVSSRHYVFMGLSHARSLNEFDVLRMLYEAGLPVPRPLAAIVWKHGLTYRAALIVERLHEV